MVSRKQLGTSFSSLLRRGWGGAARARSPRKADQRFHVERLEDRYLMDGAGFVHTDPDADPDSVVGVAGIEAQDDYIEASTGTQQLRIDVLSNDPLPDGATGLHIKMVSETAKGATVAISEDGKRLIYTPPEGGVTFDTFYYIVEDNDGKLGKANVTVGEKDSGEGYRPPYYFSRDDNYTLYEDSPIQTLKVLANDGPFATGEIIEIADQEGIGGTVEIAEDGKSLLYQAPPATTGSDRFTYTVRNAEGETATYHVSINVIKPIQTRSEDGLNFDVGTGPHVLNVLERDVILASTPETPRIVEVSQPEVGGTFQISADGQRVIYQPSEGFLGSISFEYVLRYGSLDHQVVTGYETLSIQNTFLAVDNWFAVSPGSPSQELDVLANDPTLKRRIGWSGTKPDVTLSIIGVSVGTHEGQVTISTGGKLLYTPAAGFTGEETFNYTVEDSNGHIDSAQVTVLVSEQVADAGVPKFILPGELEQFLIDQAVERYKNQFGMTQMHYTGQIEYSYTLYDTTSDVIRTTNFLSSSSDHSETNTQEAGVDEADIVETDGQFVYTFSHGKLVIVDVSDPTDPDLMSFTAFEDRYHEMYLQGDRLTLISRGWNKVSPSIVTVLDITDRANPAIVERTEIDGRIVDSRAVGDRVYVAISGVELPIVESTVTVPAEEGDPYEYRTNETLDEYVARVRSTLLETALPTYETYDAAGELIASGLLTDPTQIHKPIDTVDNDLMSLVTFDVADGEAGPDSSTGIFTSSASEVYMSGSSFYVMRNSNEETAIFKFTIDDEGTATMAATGKVGGLLLNQFSVDEHEGRLRIATTETRMETVLDRWGREITRQRQRFNNLFVLEQEGTELEVVGEIRNLAPTETIKSVRFMDDRAYVTTFRVVDPLFSVDLSDPTAPTVTGALKIPGYSDYLHPVGEDYVIGIGRDADEITGRLGPLQISLFYVGDMTNPTLVDQVTMEGAEWHLSEAWSDHHAVAYFAEDQVLTIPVGWSESVPADWDGDGIFEGTSYENHSAIWAFEIDVDQQGGGAIEIAGSVEHTSDATSYRYHGNQARRSVRVGQSLITLSDDYLKISRLHNVSEQLSEIYLGTLPRDDQFTVEEDSPEVTLDVRANDRLGIGGEAPRIVSVTQPTAGVRYWDSPIYAMNSLTLAVPMVAELTPVSQVKDVGTVEISEDGESLVFTPAENFFGTATFTYAVFDEVRGEQQATVTLTVTNTPDDPDAVDDEFEIDVDSGPTKLDVLANDANPDWGGYFPFATPYSVIDTMVISDAIFSIPYHPPSVVGLTITDISSPDQGGSIAIDPGGLGLTYTPAAGFEGIETFTYTITNHVGDTDVATVTIRVGETASLEIVDTPLPNEVEPVKPSKIESTESLPYLSRELFRPQGRQRSDTPVTQQVAHKERERVPIDRIAGRATYRAAHLDLSVPRDRAFAKLTASDLVFSSEFDSDALARELAALVG
ncbi:beta-propeller domain-containing protein [Bythopirellula goksoeyrii]|uniref:Beta propeller domain protein n=1 Tax=Bythopirellula goksoeyrii TaxID=1400387 RepID=A0A5B9QFT2_9BACT|nr:beta-propeller domain-containing protein [Bythopirellula goksoeyrii]QEG37917.1 Beta propeller domain protein [Bythopirellula goksoeyrii]